MRAENVPPLQRVVLNRPAYSLVLPSGRTSFKGTFLECLRALPIIFSSFQDLRLSLLGNEALKDTSYEAFSEVG